MPSPERRRLPTWAEEERAGDLTWIKRNWHTFWPVSQLGYKEWGHGALVGDTTIVVVHEAGAGSPFGYLAQENVEGKGWADLARMVRAYDPFQEFVVVLLKAGDHKSVYRLGTSR